MPVYTPRGLKIRLDPHYAFSLMSRLEPEIGPAEVLRHAEALENIPAACGAVATAIALAAGGPPLILATATAGGTILGGVVTRYGFFVIPGIVGLGALHAATSRLGAIFWALSIACFVAGGWMMVAGYVGGRILGGIVDEALNFRCARFYSANAGTPLTASEINFFNAYRLGAARLGRTADVELTEDDSDDAAATCLERFAREAPRAAALTLSS